jgi:hypothetical protein
MNSQYRAFLDYKEKAKAENKSFVGWAQFKRESGQKFEVLDVKSFLEDWKEPMEVVDFLNEFYERDDERGLPSREVYQHYLSHVGLDAMSANAFGRKASVMTCGYSGSDNSDACCRMYHLKRKAQP